VVVDKMFSGCEELEIFTFSNEDCEGTPDVEDMGKGAFEYCKSLKQIDLPEFIRNIGDEAFYNCISLQSINYSYLYTIGANAFVECDSLQEINLDVMRVGSLAFSGCGALSKIIIGDTFDSIEMDTTAFALCNQLKTIVINNGKISDKLINADDIGGLVKYATTIYIKIELNLPRQQRNKEVCTIKEEAFCTSPHNLLNWSLAILNDPNKVIVLAIVNIINLLSLYSHNDALNMLSNADCLANLTCSL
jgi:hypothetical protein